MKTFKRILKYSSLFIGALIFIWLSHGFYLYIRLPEINIERKSYMLYQDEIDNIGPSTILRLLIPKTRYFHNSEKYSSLFPPSVVYFKKYFSPPYLLCFRELHYQVPLTEKTFNTFLFNLEGFEYTIMTDIHYDLTRQYHRLANRESFPLTIDLVEGAFCSRKVISTYTLSLDKIGDTVTLRLKEKQ